MSRCLYRADRDFAPKSLISPPVLNLILQTSHVRSLSRLANYGYYGFLAHSKLRTRMFLLYTHSAFPFPGNMTPRIVISGLKPLYLYYQPLAPALTSLSLSSYPILSLLLVLTSSTRHLNLKNFLTLKKSCNELWDYQFMCNNPAKNYFQTFHLGFWP